MRLRKKVPPQEKKPTFAHVHVRDEGILADEEEAQHIAKNADDIEKGLRAIYRGDDTDLGVVTKESGGLTRFLGRSILFLLLILLVGVGVIWGFSRWGKDTSSEAVRVVINVPESVKSGEEVVIEIAYENPRSTALAQLAFDINLPQGFQLTTASPEPTNEEQLTWIVGTLGQYSDGKLLLTGTWYGTVPDDERIQVITTYRPANFNADFSTITTASVALHESVLDVTITGPEQASAGEEVTYTITHINTGAFAHEATAELTLPEGFIAQSWDPQLRAGGGTSWSLGLLEPGVPSVQVVQGSFASDVHDLQEMTVTSFLRGENGVEYGQEPASWLTNVLGGAVSVVLAGNGSTEQVFVAPGENIRLTVQLANISDAPVSDAQILLDFQPEQGIPVIWSDANVGKAKITAQGVILSASDIGTLAPGERKTYSFIFPLKDTAGEGGMSAFSVTAYVTSLGVTVQSVPLNVLLNAQVSLTASARYYNEGGAPLGRGVFPPRVGEETTFLLDWTFTRALHAVNNATITATLPQNVTFLALQDATIGAMTYDEATRTLTWKSTSIPEDVTSGTVHFEVAYVPDEADVDTYGKLLSGSIFRSEDAETQAILTAQVGGITTELLGDVVADSKGIVQD